MEAKRMSDFENIRDQIEILLTRAHGQLNEPECGRLLAAIKARHGDWETIARGSAVNSLAGRLIKQLADADAECSPAQVRLLEARVDERLFDPT
jgi:hypothetical protein